MGDASNWRSRYGTNSGNLTEVVVEILAPGTWHFAVRSYNSSKVESERSYATSKTIR